MAPFFESLIRVGVPTGGKEGCSHPTSYLVGFNMQTFLRISGL